MPLRPRCGVHHGAVIGECFGGVGLSYLPQLLPPLPPPHYYYYYYYYLKGPCTEKTRYKLAGQQKLGTFDKVLASNVKLLARREN